MLGAVRKPSDRLLLPPVHSRRRIRCQRRVRRQVRFQRIFPRFSIPRMFVAGLLDLAGHRWRSGWSVSGGSLRSPGMSESPRQQTHWPWMHELQVLDDDAGLDDVALAVDQQRELAQRPAVYASPLAFEWRPQAPAGRGRVKTQNQIPRIRFWRFSINRFPQNRTTIDLFADFSHRDVSAPPGLYCLFSSVCRRR